MASFDYVIVGAGSAGCVLANRLSADPNVSVALIEAGGSDRHPYISMPRGVAKLMAMPSLTWLYATVPDAFTAMRPDYWPRGKVLGGSSSVNGMIWVRGQPADYDALAAVSSETWNWANFARAFEAIEGHVLGPAPSRGGSGPLRISLSRLKSRLTGGLLAAGGAMGWPVKQDINEPDDGTGIGPAPRTIWRGKRQSASVAFLRPVRRRPNLKIISDALVDKILFDGKRARGVELLRDGQREIIECRRETILCAGAIASPGILERSGIGDPARLAGHGIPLVHASPAVGERTSEHRAFRMQWRLSGPWSFNPDFQGWRLVRSVIQYYLTGDGPMSGASMDIRGAFPSHTGMLRPDIHVQFGFYSWDLAGGTNRLETTHGLCAVIGPLRPESRGSIHISSPDPAAAPMIETNYGGIAKDRVVTVAAVRLVRQMFDQPGLSEMIAAETTPGPAIQSDEELLAVLDTLGVPCMHTVGSCRMGKDEGSVVDPELRVRGVKGLRVCDASLFPVIPAGNTNAPVLALAWLASERIAAG